MWMCFTLFLSFVIFQTAGSLQETALSNSIQKPAESPINLDSFLYPPSLFDSFSLAANLMASSGAGASTPQNIISMLFQQPTTTAHPPASSTPNSTEDGINDLTIEVSFLLHNAAFWKYVNVLFAHFNSFC